MPEFDDDIDYMHPFGKQEEIKGQEITEGESAKVDEHRMKYALQEADGHSLKKPDPFLDDQDLEDQDPDDEEA